jgi:hypothetical protein
MYAIHKLYGSKFVVLATTATHCQCLISANMNHTYFVAEWIPLDMVTLVLPSQPGNFFSCKVEDALEIAAEKLGQLHLK